MCPGNLKFFSSKKGPTKSVYHFVVSLYLWLYLLGSDENPWLMQYTKDKCVWSDFNHQFRNQHINLTSSSQYTHTQLLLT